MLVSELEELDCVQFPEPDDNRIQMMPFVIGEPNSLPGALSPWVALIQQCSKAFSDHYGQVGYLTIDQAHLKAGERLRRGGRHIDNAPGVIGAWAPIGPPVWGGRYGMVMASNVTACAAWIGEIEATVGPNGECDFEETDSTRVDLKPNHLYWMNGDCIHESLPVRKDAHRQFIRISSPSEGVWYNHYTPNPNVLPTGPIVEDARVW